MKNYIYVIDINGNPLMPTSRHSKVRKLLKEKKAKIVDYLPFSNCIVNSGLPTIYNTVTL